MRTFLTVSQSGDAVAQSGEALNTDDVKRITLQRHTVGKFCLI